MEYSDPSENNHPRANNTTKRRIIDLISTEEGDKGIAKDKRRRNAIVLRAVMEVKPLDTPLLSAATASQVDSLRLRPHRRYSIGRSKHRSEFLFQDPRVSRRHCQVSFDPLRRKILIRVFPSSLNGLFVNGVGVEMETELSAGDEVSLVCSNRSCRFKSHVRVGFIVESVLFEERIVSRSRLDSESQSQGSMVSSRRGHKRVFASKVNDETEITFPGFETEGVVDRANPILSRCRDILRSEEGCIEATTGKIPVPVVDSLCGQNGGDVIMENDNTRICEVLSPFDNGVVKSKMPGKTFYLNRLGFMDDSASNHRTDVSLQELLHPVENISQMFIATFTSDILWFLSSCEIPRNLPVTVACHSTERCWNSSPEKRSSAPYPDFPNLVVVYPMFPEDIAFGKDLKRQGIGCHHPKLLVLQRDDFLRVIVTSANLVPSQWNVVTNTVWWQDFPRRSSPDYMPLFTQIHDGDINQEIKSDFCSHLAGFMASLLTDVPSQAHWIIELSKYDFSASVAHLVTSVPGIHSYRAPNIFPSIHFVQGSSGTKFLGSVEASVVGLSYLYHREADSTGPLLKKLASFLEKSRESSDGFVKVLFRRNKNIPADENAMSILVPGPKEISHEDYVPLGFLPKKAAKWASPLWDIGFFSFSAYVCRKDALTAALGGSSKKATLLIHVSQGPNFKHISEMIQPEHMVAISSMIAGIQRCTGLWRLQEVLSQYKWPEELESDFIYSSSSIGAINARFLAAFAAAGGKTSLQFDSDESDPEWGCWSASQEKKNPSIRILFPTITRVKNACTGVLPSKRILCFSEKTWERVRTVDILHDAIPHPYNRVGHPMHVKVARRQFKSKKNGSSFGWIYCGSHNFSAAAWGRPISDSSASKADQERNHGSAASSNSLRLHVGNYELGIVFTFPPSESKLSSSESQTSSSLDSIVLPFVVPAPKYGPRDRPATAKAMRGVLNDMERQSLVEAEEVPYEDDSGEETNLVVEEKEDEKTYAAMLWGQIGLSNRGLIL